MTLEIVGVVSGLLCVVLLGRQNIFTWPLGLAYALVSLVVFLQTEVYGQVLLHVVFVSLNAWGWYAWLSQRRDHSEQVRNVSRPLWLWLIALFGLVTVAVEFGINRPFGGLGGWLDSVVAAGSLLAIWMQSRRYLQVWIVWFILNLGSIVLYYSMELTGYALLYLVYLGLAVWGYRQWQASLASDAEGGATA